jgi:hypothetical protein
MGSDMNPFYLDFWPVVSKVWKEKFNITPVLGLVCNENSDLIETEHGFIKKFKAVEGIDVGLQSQIVRLYIPKFIEGKCLISDIDMIPLSKKYFDENSRYVTDDNLVIYSSNHPQTVKNKMFPMCYVAAHSKVYKQIFDINSDWKTFCELLFMRGESWYTDQKYLFEKAIDFEDKTGKLVLLERDWKSEISNRVDRANWGYFHELVKNGYYIDCHSLRPYDKYKTEIDNLINTI